VAEHRVQELGLPAIRSHGARRLGGLPGSDAAVIRIKGDSIPVMPESSNGDAVPKIHRADGGLQRRLRLSRSL
jgi:hypothetical protein